MNPKLSEHMTVDTSLRQQLRININISFHALSCADVHLDAMDVAGDNQLNVEHDMLKQRLSKKGVILNKPNLASVHIVRASVFKIHHAISYFDVLGF